MHLALLPSLAETGGDVGLAVGLGILVAAVGVLLALFNLIGRLRQVDERLARLNSLKAIEGDLRSMVEGQGKLDLRRLEHVLIDIRDGQRRVEERTLAVLEAGTQQREAPTSAATEGRPPSPGTKQGGPALADRIVTRLLALGYERVELITPAEELSRLGTHDGDALVEARRHGAMHKGKVAICDGVIADIQLRAAYELFP